MRLRILWSAVTSTRTRVTAVTAIAMTLAAVLVSAADADPAQDAAKEREIATAEAGEIRPSGERLARVSRLQSDQRWRQQGIPLRR